MKRVTKFVLSAQAGSIWSAVNIRNVDRLLKEDRMQPAGIRAYEGRKENDPASTPTNNEVLNWSSRIWKNSNETKRRGSFPGPAALLPQGYELVGCQCEERRDAT